MKTDSLSTPQKLLLSDYTAPDFRVDSLFLNFDLHAEYTIVTQRSHWSRNSHSKPSLRLDGENLELLSFKIDGNDFLNTVTDSFLEFTPPSDFFELEIQTKIYPHRNTDLEGLYLSGGIYVTQCEAQGFRRITYFLDRPDVMTKYQVRIEADKANYPVLLSNGDRVAQEDLGSRHAATWEDPFKKPSYLFAMVAGNLGVLEDQMTTKSGRSVKLQFFSRHGTQHLCHHAMESLKKSMTWDEERYGREYDLSTYMILAIDDFNMGAMENKGLNVFSSRYIFADPKTATDEDFYDIESIVAHEYFHNWTGNRITVRDWFHLSLKEGLTVFRDQEFSSDMTDRDLVRIRTVADLRTSQFAEDAGPNAHPIRPSSCYAVDNFYTSTVYSKGSEIIRMLNTMAGRPGFRKGMDHYFESFDGCAVVLEDFAGSIAKPNNLDLSQFKLWYSQAGTPLVSVQESYDAGLKEYRLTLSQSCSWTAQEKQEGMKKAPFQIPLALALFDNTIGQELSLNCPDVVRNSEGQNLIYLTETSQTYRFVDVPTRPVLSLNRQFSAPVRLEKESSTEDLLFLLKYETDSFSRWEALQVLLKDLFLKNLRALAEGGSCSFDPNLKEAFKYVLENKNIFEGIKAELLSPPDDSILVQELEVLDGLCLGRARKEFYQWMAQELKAELLEIYRSSHGVNTSSRDPKDFGKRALKNTCLFYLSSLPEGEALAWTQFQTADIMTDQLSALKCLIQSERYRTQALQMFFDQWKENSLVLQKWYGLIALSDHKETFARVKTIWSAPSFNRKQPATVYSLIWRFADNLSQMWNGDLERINFMKEVILEMDGINSQVASRLAGGFDLWSKLKPEIRVHTQNVLRDLLQQKLSKNTYEILEKSLQST